MEPLLWFNGSVVTSARAEQREKLSQSLGPLQVHLAAGRGFCIIGAASNQQRLQLAQAEKPVAPSHALTPNPSVKRTLHGLESWPH